MSKPTPMFPPRRQGFFSQAAFTLTEVVIALGIMVFVIGTVVSVLPYALQTHRDSNYETVLAGVVQDLSREIEQTPFKSATAGGKELDSYHNQIYFFDYEGFKTEERDKAVFQVLIEIEDVKLGLDQSGGGDPGGDPDLDDPALVTGYLQRGLSDDTTKVVLLKSAVLYVLPVPPVPEPKQPQAIKEDTRTKVYHVIINDKGGETQSV